MKRILSLLLLATAFALAGCKPVAPADRAGNGTVNADDGKHTISELGKWRYGNVMSPSPKFPQCRWEVWGLQRDGWKQLYKGKGVGKVELPPAGVYNAAYLKSSNCGSWRVTKKAS